MLTRRHIRVKVMQCIYALVLTKDESLDKQDKFLKLSIENTYVLYLLVIDLFRELHKLAAKYAAHSDKKYISEPGESFPDGKRISPSQPTFMFPPRFRKTRNLHS